MLFNRKGDLAISTNAIVVLIIAVIMLGLIITFVTKGFASVTDKITAEMEKQPDPIAPSSSQPVTSSENVVVQQSSDFGVKVSVYNKGTATLPFLPLISCTGINFDPMNSRSIPAKSYATYIAVGKATTASAGKHLCSICSDSASGVCASGADTGDLVVTVRS